MCTDRAIILKSYIDSLAVASIMNNLQPEKKYIFFVNKQTDELRQLWKLISRADIKKYTKYLETKFEVGSGFKCESIFEQK